MSGTVSMDDAYAEACKALGEQTVIVRLLQARLADVEARLAAATGPVTPLTLADA